jgi:hypothetical protein
VGEVSSIDPRLLQQLLVEQRREIDQAEYVSLAIPGVITSRNSAWLLDTGLQLLDGADPLGRILGSRFIRELVPLDAAVTTKVLAKLDSEQDAVVVAWLIKALAFLGQSEALPAVSRFVDHPCGEVREAVATAISGCSSAQLSAGARAALLNLARDVDPGVRFSAVFELGEWWHRDRADVLIEHELRNATHDVAASVQHAANAALAPTE